MNTPQPHQVVSALPVFADYRRALAAWLLGETTDEAELRRQSVAVCAAARAAGVPAEQILVALRANGIVPRWGKRTPGSAEERIDQRYTTAIKLLLVVCHEEVPDGPRCEGEGQSRE